MSFRAFVGDKQMSSCLKAILESLAPGNPYVVCLYGAPIRQSATGDIGRGNFNNRPRGGRKAGKADADSTHCCSPDAGIDACSRPALFLPGAWPMMVGSRRLQSLHCRSQLKSVIDLWQTVVTTVQSKAKVSG